MMTTRLVFRLLAVNGELLGWTEDEAEVRGDGCLRASSTISVITEQSGIAHRVSTHWVDINVETSVPLDVSVYVQSGVAVTIFQRGVAVVSVGAPAGGLPPVTVGRPVVIGVPVGHTRVEPASVADLSIR